jgi:hypothetical protein
MINRLTNIGGSYANEAPLTGRQANLDAILAQAGQGSSNMSQMDWIRVQQQLDEYNRDVTFQSTVIKVVGDSIKSILRNIT